MPCSRVFGLVDQWRVIMQVVDDDKGNLRLAVVEHETARVQRVVDLARRPSRKPPAMIAGSFCGVMSMADAPARSGDCARQGATTRPSVMTVSKVAEKGGCFMTFGWDLSSRSIAVGKPP